MASPDERLTAKLEQLPISDDAPMCSLLRTTLLKHAQHGSDITEPTVLGLLAITGAPRRTPHPTRSHDSALPHTMTAPPPRIDRRKARPKIRDWNGNEASRPHPYVG